MLDERFTHCLARNLSPEPPHLAMGARNKGGMCNLTLDLSAKVMAGTWLDVREGGMTEPAAQRVIRSAWLCQDLKRLILLSIFIWI